MITIILAKVKRVVAKIWIVCAAMRKARWSSTIANKHSTFQKSSFIHKSILTGTRSFEEINECLFFSCVVEHPALPKSGAEMKQEIELTVFCKFPSLLTFFYCFFLIFHLSYQFCNFPFFNDICCCCRCKFPYMITSVCIVRISITIFVFFCNFPSLSQFF